jgi:hypothetical protein
MKIIKNSKDFFDQSLDEIKLLKLLNRADPSDEHGACGGWAHNGARHLRAALCLGGAHRVARVCFVVCASCTY